MGGRGRPHGAVRRGGWGRLNGLLRPLLGALLALACVAAARCAHADSSNPELEAKRRRLQVQCATTLNILGLNNIPANVNSFDLDIAIANYRAAFAAEITAVVAGSHAPEPNVLSPAEAIERLRMFATQLTQSAGGCDAACQARQRQALLDMGAQLAAADWIDEELRDYWLPGGAGNSLHHCCWKGVECCGADAQLLIGKLSGANTDQITWESSKQQGVVCTRPGGVAGINLDKISRRADRSSNGVVFPEAAIAAVQDSLEVLLLASAGMGGTFPAMLTTMPLLTTLSLGGNDFTGTLPSTPWPVFLRDLSIHTNRLEGSIPSTLAEPLQLRYVSLSYNDFTGSVPLGLFSAPSITTIDISHNRGLRGEVQNGAQLRSLVTQFGVRAMNNINIRGTSISGSIPKWVTDTPVTSLDLGDNGLSGSIPNDFGSIPELRELMLDGNLFSGTIPPHIAGADLTVLDLSYNQLSGTLPEQLALASNLEVINLSQNPGLVGSIPAAYANLRNVRVFNAQGTGLRHLGVPNSRGEQLPEFLRYIPQGQIRVFAGTRVECKPIGGLTVGNTCLSGDQLRCINWKEVVLEPAYHHYQGCTCPEGMDEEWSEDAEGFPQLECIVPESVSILLTVIPPVCAVVLALVIVAGVLVFYRRRIQQHYHQRRKRRGPPMGNDGPVTLVNTDIVGSTLLWELDPVAMLAALNVHNAVLRRALLPHYGYEIQTEGDSFTIAFHDTEDAVMWCIATQQALSTADWPKDIRPIPDEHYNFRSGAPMCADSQPGTLLSRGLRVRMTIATGDAVCSTRGKLLYAGPVVDELAALQGLPAGGQILMDANTFQSTMPKLAAMSLTAYASPSTQAVRAMVRLEERSFADRTELNITSLDEGPLLTIKQSAELGEADREGIVPPRDGGGTTTGYRASMDATPAPPGVRASVDAGGFPRKNANGEEVDVVNEGSSDDDANDSGPNMFAKLLQRKRAKRWFQKATSEGSMDFGVDRSSSVKLDLIPVIHMGEYQVAGFREEAQSLYQVLVPGLEARGLHFPQPRGATKLSLGFFDAPGARSASLGPMTSFTAGKDHAHTGVADTEANLGSTGTLPRVAIVFCAATNLTGHVDVVDEKGEKSQSRINEGSSGAMAARTPKDVELAMELYLSLVRATLPVFNGYECKEQQGVVMAALPSVADGIGWALTLQEQLLSMAWPPEFLSRPGCGPESNPSTGVLAFRGVRVRIGLFAGRPTRIAPNPATARVDYFGPVVNQAARLCFVAAQGGQVILTKAQALSCLGSAKHAPRGPAGNRGSERGEGRNTPSRRVDSSAEMARASSRSARAGPEHDKAAAHADSQRKRRATDGGSSASGSGRGESGIERHGSVPHRKSNLGPVKPPLPARQSSEAFANNFGSLLVLIALGRATLARRSGTESARSAGRPYSHQTPSEGCAAAPEAPVRPGYIGAPPLHTGCTVSSSGNSAFQPFHGAHAAARRPFEVSAYNAGRFQFKGISVPVDVCYLSTPMLDARSYITKISKKGRGIAAARAARGIKDKVEAPVMLSSGMMEVQRLPHAATAEMVSRLTAMRGTAPPSGGSHPKSRQSGGPVGVTRFGRKGRLTDSSRQSSSRLRHGLGGASSAAQGSGAPGGSGHRPRPRPHAQSGVREASMLAPLAGGMSVGVNALLMHHNVGEVPLEVHEGAHAQVCLSGGEGLGVPRHLGGSPLKHVSRNSPHYIGAGSSGHRSSRQPSEAEYQH
ncbi:unnamed protein product [Pedinophyceae sp. YPF-701]|nr:unnamed protein product [Pedinophyceae sp. YPF-701]